MTRLRSTVPVAMLAAAIGILTYLFVEMIVNPLLG